MDKFVAYFRVSTARQGRSGLGLAAQRAAVDDLIAANGNKLIAEFQEVESGKDRDRPKLAAALDHCRVTDATGAETPGRPRPYADRYLPLRGQDVIRRPILTPRQIVRGAKGRAGKARR